MCHAFSAETGFRASGDGRKTKRSVVIYPIISDSWTGKVEGNSIIELVGHESNSEQQEECPEGLTDN